MEDKTVFQPAPGGSVRAGARLNGIYEIERLIAEGGMGEVYKGFAIQTGDAVAIKMIRPEMSRSPDAMALFRREASILHNLQNDAVVRYYVFSIDPDLQRAYLAMEFVDGPSLTKRLASGPLPLAETRILKARIAGALEAAHRLGIVHRDISSDNVILPAGDVRRAKIIDFGIARTLGAAEGTIIGSGFAGKFNYVSPEQLGLAGGDVTFKSDIYSFGLVLAEALRGKPIDMGGTQVDLIEKRRKVPDLSDIDPAIRPLLQAMLQPAPESRPASMAAVAAWGEPDPRDAPRERSGGEATASPPLRGSSGGKVAAGLAAVIAVVSVAGALYVFRDDLRSALAPKTEIAAPPAKTPTGGVTQPPALPSPQPAGGETKPPLLPPTQPAEGETKPPALPPPTGGEAKPPSAEPSIGGVPPAQVQPPAGAETKPTATPSTGGQGAAPPPVNPPHVPTKEELVDALPPRALQPSFVLSEAKLGAPFRQELPAFIDPGAKGLTITAESEPPAGLALRDLGGGRSAIEGTPASAGTATFAILARNHNGRTAEMRVTATIADKAAPPPRVEAPKPATAVAVLDAASVGKDYRAAVPAFEAGANARAVSLRVERALPDGLAFADLGGGRGEISGRPTRDGAFSFDVVATNDAGLAARMTAKLVVAPKPAAPPPTAGPPRPSQSEATLASATVGQDFTADLPPVEAGANARSVTLRVDRALPEGLAFADIGGGVGRISGRASREGSFTIGIVATNDAGLATRMTAKLVVAPKPAAPPPTAGPPRPSQSEATLASATVGQDFTADLPPVEAGANARNVTLRVERGLPEGLAFADIGGGVGRISGRASREGSFTIGIVATNDAGLATRMTAKLVVAPKPAAPPPVGPPRPSQSEVALEGATVGQPFSAELPVFEAGANAHSVALRADRALPEGLAFSDLGGGVGRVSGQAARDGSFAFDVLATNDKGLTAHMGVRIAVAPRAAAPPPAIPPRASQSEVALEPATVGKTFSADLPPFEPGGAAGLALAAERGLPDGLAFSDLGGGRSRLSGLPAREGSYAVEIVATDGAGQSARMIARLVVAPPAAAPPAVAPTVAPPRPAQDAVSLENAIVGRDYVAQFPPFDAGSNAREVSLRVEPAPPEGLTFADLGSGLSELSGKPAREGEFAFEVVAVNERGLTGHMAVRIVVGAPPAPAKTAAAPPTQPVTEPKTASAAPTQSVAERAQAFLRGYDDGGCFVAGPAPRAEPSGVEAVGVDKAAFQRFESAFQQSVGAEPIIAAHLIVAPECPAVDLLRLSNASGAAAPRIELVGAEVGKGRPLAGTVSGLAGRKVIVLVIDNDGFAHRLEAKPSPGGDAASFTAPLVGDDASIGPPQVLLAIASDAPFAAIDTFRHGPAADLARKLAGQWTEARANAAAAFFKLSR